MGEGAGEKKSPGLKGRIKGGRNFVREYRGKKRHKTGIRGESNRGTQEKGKGEENFEEEGWVGPTKKSAKKAKRLRRNGVRGKRVVEGPEKSPQLLHRGV